jgi:hypothetical protein
MQIHIYITAWEPYPNVSHNPVAMVTNFAIICEVHAQVDETVKHSAYDVA